MSNSKKLPPDIIKHWPEVFNDVEVQAVPIRYIQSVLVHFDDGTTYEIDIDSSEIDDNVNEDIVEDTLEAFFEEYEDLIEGIEFKLHTKKVIRDIKAHTKKFLKRNK